MPLVDTGSEHLSKRGDRSRRSRARRTLDIAVHKPLLVQEEQSAQDFAAKNRDCRLGQAAEPLDVRVERAGVHEFHRDPQVLLPLLHTDWVSQLCPVARRMRTTCLGAKVGCELRAEIAEGERLQLAVDRVHISGRLLHTRAPCDRISVHAAMLQSSSRQG